MFISAVTYPYCVVKSSKRQELVKISLNALVLILVLAAQEVHLEI